MNNKIRKNMQQLQAKRKDYAEFEQLVKELKTKIKNKELTINELKNELKDRYKDINLLELKMKDDETTIEESKTQINKLKSENKALAYESINNTKKSVSSQLNDDYKHNNNNTKKKEDQLINLDELKSIDWEDDDEGMGIGF